MIDTEALKRKIIGLAVSGKLTNHLCGDANEELSSIIKKFGNEDQRVFDNIEKWTDIPSNWTWARLKDLTTNRTLNDGDWVLSKDMVQEGPVKLIQLGSIGDCEYKYKGFKYLTEDHFHELKGKQIYPGYLLINRLVVDKMLTCIVPDIKGILMTAVDVLWIAPNDGLYNLEYLMYVMSSFGVQQKVKELGYGVTRFRISKLNLIDIVFPLPPISEQYDIVKKIKELLSLLKTIDFLHCKYAADAEILKSKLIDAAIQGKLTEQLPSDGTAEELYQQIQTEKQALISAGKIKKEKPLKEIEEDEMPFEIPESWKWVRLNDVGSWSAGATPYRKNSDYYKNGKMPWIKTGELKNDYIDSSEEYITELALNECSLRINPAGSVLIAMYGATIVKVGILNIDATTNQACCACIPIKICNKYLFYFLIQNKNNFLSASHGGAQPNISKEIIVNSLMPLPPLAEQERIVERIEEVLQYCQ